MASFADWLRAQGIDATRLPPALLAQLLAQWQALAASTTGVQAVAQPNTSSTGVEQVTQPSTSSTGVESITQPTTSSTGIAGPIVQPTTSSTGIQQIVQPTTSSTGIQQITQPTTSSTGIQQVTQPTTSSTGIQSGTELPPGPSGGLTLEEARRREARLHNRSQAVAFGQQIGQGWQRFIDGLVPRGLVRAIILGLCLAVDPTTHTATFLLPGVPGQTTWPGVRYGYPWRAPRVGERLPVFIAALGAGQMAWVEPPGGTARWLYFRQFGGPEGATLWRCQWPPTADAVVEQGHYVAVTGGATPRLLDYHQGTGSIYAQDVEWFRYGTPEDLPPGVGTVVERVPQWGFGAPTQTPLDQPARTLLGTVPAYPTDDPAAVPFSAVLPSARAAYTDAFGGSQYYLPTETFSVSMDGGGTFADVQTLEWERRVSFTGPPAGYGLPGDLAHIHIVAEGGRLNNYSGPSGFVLVADASGLGSAGDAIFALPAHLLNNYGADQHVWDQRFDTYPARLALSGGGASFTLGSLMAAPDWAPELPSWIWRQAAAGSWVAYRPVAGAIDDLDGTVPYAWYVGTGADLTSLTWRPLAIPGTTFSAFDHGNVLAVGLDGQDVLAWSAGESSAGARYYSTDAGATWQAVAQPTLVDNQGAYFAFDDMLLVDIPADSPYAEPQT